MLAWILPLIPTVIKKRKLEDLFRLTADAFQTGMPALRGLSFRKSLEKYALFTKEQAENYLQSGRPAGELKERLYRNSRLYGEKIRRNLRLKSRDDAAAALSMLYRMIGIDFKCDNSGNFEIHQCYFSRFYNEEVCQLVSSLDQGLAAGLYGGCALDFDRRITGGSACCGGSINER